MTSTLNSLLQTLRIGTSVPKKTPPPPHKSFPQESTNGLLPRGLPEITLEAVAQHDDYCDCWIVVYDRVYDVTNFLREHPGGEDIIMDHAGRDATLAFHGTGHSRDAIELLGEYLIGELPTKERIFRKDNAKVLSMGVPL